jgi:hypothetical protein
MHRWYYYYYYYCSGTPKNIAMQPNVAKIASVGMAIFQNILLMLIFCMAMPLFYEILILKTPKPSLTEYN